jgi:chromosome segregation ATPase
MTREDIQKKMNEFQEKSRAIQSRLIRLDEQKKTLQIEIAKIEETLKAEIGDVSEENLQIKIDGFYEELGKLMEEAEKAYAEIE